MKSILFLFPILALSCVGAPKVHYLDQDFPTKNPKIYAPKVFSLPDRFEHGISMRKNGKEHYSIISRRAWKYLGILRYTFDESGNLTEETITFQDHINPEVKSILAGEACFSQDERTMYFVSDYPTDIWKSTIDSKGIWQAPAKLDSSITEGTSEWFPFIASDHALYYSKEIDGKGSIHRSELAEGEYQNGQKLEAPFNYDCGDQVFNHAMNIIIFASPREGGYGNQDLYVAFKNGEGKWSEGINLGGEINTEGWELAPFISPDEKYLFFTRRDKFKGATSSDIYWVSMDVIADIKKSQ